jgi:SAM-dependent methyltransferase
MREASKAVVRRSFDRRFATQWFVGAGIDVGAGNDSLGFYSWVFPMMRGVRAWDLSDGDAMMMDGVPNNAYDFVHSSHCLEHLSDPFLAFSNWIRICRPNGHLVITVPDEDLYEQGQFPSTFNSDHKWTFTILKASSWSRSSINIVDLCARYSGQISILKLELLDSGFDYSRPRCDQTLGSLAESAIEIVLRKL